MHPTKHDKITTTNWRTGAKLPVSTPSPNKQRGSLEDAFPGLRITRVTTVAPVAPPTVSSTPGKATLARLRGGFSNRGSFKRGANASESPLAFTLTRKQGLEYYSRDEVATAAFDDAASMIVEMRGLIAASPATLATSLDEALHEEMCAAIFGSNLIERAGIPELGETRRICLEIFAGKRDFFEEIEPRSPEYEKLLEAAIDAGSAARPRRDRREVANHAAAMVYIIRKIVKENQSLSEEIIKETHRILCMNVDAVNGSKTAWEDYAGVYRCRDGTDNVGAGSTNFVRPAKVAGCMARFVEDINTMIRDAEIRQELDPFYLAAHACGEFVNIHPFIDGNGRTCRLILNAILLKYTGILAPIGENEKERREYLDIARRRGEEQIGNGELAAYTLTKAVGRLSAMMSKMKSSPKK